MAGALAAIMGGGGERGIEEDQAFGREPAILDEAEGERVDARPPGQVRRRAAEARHRIGEAGAVDVEAEAARLGEVAERRGLGGRVDAAIFAGVGDRERGRLDLVDVVADRREQAGHRRRA